MLHDRGMQVMNVELVADAYAIAANYLRLSGALPETITPDERLVDVIVQLIHRGEFNKLRLANKAISMFEMAYAA
ncbi:hypothetical protein [Bradyrhizobium sp. SRS-191]|uniref:hypothetical protein n=1 Tax=Bradyrhizobium sp. SRS-191 TaxID=2962606 RepID=UPI00211DC694|nr:hypothetical protein [Bradyrhizobium sp. SRS-191]